MFYDRIILPDAGDIILVLRKFAMLQCLRNSFFNVWEGSTMQLNMQFAVGRLQTATLEQQHSTVNIKHNKEDAQQNFQLNYNYCK